MAFGGLSAGSLGDIAILVKISGMEKATADLGNLDAKVARASQTINKALNISIMASVAAFGLASNAAIKFESSFTGVTKTVDGLRDPMGKLNEDGKKLAQQFRELSLEIPTSVNELNKIGELGGQLGIARTDLIGFTDTVARLGVTTDLTYESASMNLAKFVNITKQVAPEGMTAAEQIARLGSTIVDLGNNTATTESAILEMSMRIAGAGTQVGMTQPEIMGMAAALSSVGIEAQMGGTAISKAMIEIAGAVDKGGQRLDTFAQIAGMSADQFKTKFEQDAAGAISLFIQGLGNVKESGGSTFAVLEELGLSETRLRDALLRASNASDIFNSSLELGKSAYETNNALIKESEQRFMTVESQIQLFKNALNDVFITLGQDFLPAITNVLTYFREHNQIIPIAITTIVKLATVMGPLALGIKAVSMAMAASPLGLMLIGIVALTAGIIALTEAAKRRHTAQLKEIGATSDEIDEFNKLAAEYKSTKTESGKLQEIAKKLEDAFREQGEEVVVTKDNIAELTEKYKELRLQKLRDQLDEVNKKLEGGSFGSNLLMAAFGELGRVTGDTQLQTKYMADQAGKLIEKQDVLEKEIGVLNGTIKENNTKTNELTQKTKDAGDAVNITAGKVKTLAERMNDLKDANIPTTQSIQDEIDRLVDLKTAAGDDSVAILNLAGQINDLKDKLDPLGTAFDDVQKSMKDTSDQAHGIGFVDIIQPTKELKDETDKTRDSMIKTGLIITDMIGKLGGLGEEINRTAQFIATLAASGLNPLQIMLSGISFMISAIIGWDDHTGALKVTTEELLERLGDLGDEIERVGGLIEELSDKYESDLTQSLKDLLKVQEDEAAMWAAEIDRLELLGASIEKPIEQWGILEYQLQGARTEFERATAAINETNNALSRLSEFYGFKKSFDALIEGIDYLTTQAMDMVNYFGIIEFPGVEGLIDLLNEQITANEAMLENLEPTSQAYADMYEAIMRAKYAVAVLTGAVDTSVTSFEQWAGILPDNTALIEDLNLQIADLNQTVADLEQQKVEIDIKLAEDIAPIESQVLAINDAVELLGQPGGLYAFHDAMQAILGTTREWAVVWEDAIGNIIGDYSLFETDMKTASDTLAELLYFNIDFDTTNADEQIAGLIFRMQDFLSKLDPESQAYKDFSAMLQVLIDDFLAAGGSLDEAARETAVIVETQTAEDVIADLKAQIEELVRIAEENKANIQVEINDALAQLDILTERLNALAKGITIPIDIEMPMPVDVTYTTIGGQTYTGGSNKGSRGVAMHAGGIVNAALLADLPRAHSGAMIDRHLGTRVFGSYKGKRQVPILALEDEAIIRPEVAGKFSEADWDKFNRTGDPRALGRQDPSLQQRITINVNEATRRTWVEATEQYITPAMQAEQSRSVTPEDVTAVHFGGRRPRSSHF